MSRLGNLLARHQDAPDPVPPPPPPGSRPSTRTPPTRPTWTRPPPASPSGGARASAATPPTPPTAWTGHTSGSWSRSWGTGAGSRACPPPGAAVGASLGRGTPGCAGRARGWAPPREGWRRCRWERPLAGGLTCSPTEPARLFCQMHFLGECWAMIDCDRVVCQIMRNRTFWMLFQFPHFRN